MTWTRHASPVRALLFAIGVSTAAGLLAQGPPQPPPGPPRSPRAAAPVDLTGVWVSVVTEDWQWRMVTPKKGDYASVPLNAEGQRVADTWTESKDGQCEAYGVGGIMRMPGRLRISWQDENTLKIESDAGQQTRLLRFEAPKVPPAPSRQGLSMARWLGRASLTVETSRLLPGYLQTNGVPYSANATMEEHFDVVKEPNGEQWLIIDTIVTDPTYLFRTFVRSTHFKKEADGSKWDPQPCIVKW